MVILLSHPRQQKELSGHTSTITYLWQAFLDNRLAPAWLLCGPKGIGKATLAYALSRQILSKNSNNPNGLSESIVSHQIDVGSFPNLYTLDSSQSETATQEITVDDMRKLIDFLHQKPFLPGWRIVIIDAVDDMNSHAANALLKVLEEPPSQTLFLLICHTLGKILPTIRSRCQKINCAPAHQISNIKMTEAQDSLFKAVNYSLGTYAELSALNTDHLLERLLQALDRLSENHAAWFQDIPSLLQEATKSQEAAFYRLLLSLLHKRALQAHPQQQAFTTAYHKFFTFLENSAGTHLDKAQRCLAGFLLIEEAFRSPAPYSQIRS